MRPRNKEKGFTLIELGLVIAVIAILALVVLMGAGLIGSSTETKVYDAVRQMVDQTGFIARSKAGFPDVGTTAELDYLVTKKIATKSPMDIVGAQYRITAVDWSPGTGNVAVTVTCPTTDRGPTVCEDVYTQVASKHPLHVATGTFGATACTEAAPTAGGAMNLCFNVL